MRELSFVKGHGTLNDFVVLSDPDRSLGLTDEEIRFLCDRRAGIGADGVLICRSQYESPEVDGEIVVRYEGQEFGGTPAEELCGRFIDVKITGADEYDLIAEPV